MKDDWQFAIFSSREDLQSISKFRKEVLADHTKGAQSVIIWIDNEGTK